MTGEQKWHLTVAWAEANVPGFEIRYKPDHWHQRLAVKILKPFNDYMTFTSTLGAKVYFASREKVEKCPWTTLQHELVHCIDANTFYGLLPWLPRHVCCVLFALCYTFPFPLPVPAPGRMYAELRAFRRSLEVKEATSKRISTYVSRFTSWDYYKMWPFAQHVEKLLTSDESPYRTEMDTIFEESVEDSPTPATDQG